MPMGLCMFDEDQRLARLQRPVHRHVRTVDKELATPGTPFRKIIEARIANGLWVGRHDGGLSRRAARVRARDAAQHQGAGAERRPHHRGHARADVRTAAGSRRTRTSRSCARIEAQMHAHGAPRRADRPAQSRRSCASASRRSWSSDAVRRALARGAHVRHRPLQGGQRYARTVDRRRAAAGRSRSGCAAASRASR